jgi:hypothetical protein
MPTLDSGTLGPFEMWNSFQGRRWECPTWYTGVVCGTKVLDSANFNWRLDTYDVANFNGTNKGVRILPETNKCIWTWSEGSVVNQYSRGAVIGTINPGGGVTVISSEPKFEAEVYSLVPGATEGTIEDPGTDGLTGFCTSDPGEEIHSFAAYTTFGTVGWRATRYKYGITWRVSAAQIAGVWRWLLTGDATWSWMWRNTAKYTTGTVSGAAGTFSRVGLHAAENVYGGTGGSDRNALGLAGTRSPLYPSGLSFPTGAICDTYSGPTGGVRPANLMTVFAGAVTEETVRDLATTPASDPPGHRLWRGTGNSLNFHNQITFQYASDDPIACSTDLFTGNTISMSLLPGLPNVDEGYYADSFGLSLPETCSIMFSNT